MLSFPTLPRLLSFSIKKVNSLPIIIAHYYILLMLLEFQVLYDAIFIMIIHLNNKYDVNYPVLIGRSGCYLAQLTFS